MELYHLKAFVQIGKSGNLTRAAERLHISPSALSTQIKSLEAELGVPLFIRQTRGMTLTREGEALLAHARSTIEAAERLQQQARQLQQQPVTILRIGLNTAPDFLRISRISEHLPKVLAGVKIRYVKSDSLDTPRLLRQGLIDVGFVFGDAFGAEIRIDPLARVAVHVVIPHRLLPAGPAPEWEEIARLPWIWVERHVACHAAFQRQLDQRGLTLNTVSYAVDDSITRELIRDGHGLALLRGDEAQRLVTEGCASIWPPGTVTVPLGLAWLAEKEDSPLLRGARQQIIGLWEHNGPPPQ